MQDKIMELLRESLDAANVAESLANKVEPLLVQIEANAENVNPELMDLYKNHLSKVQKSIRDLKVEKENLQNFDK